MFVCLYKPIKPGHFEKLNIHNYYSCVNSRQSSPFNHLETLKLTSFFVFCEKIGFGFMYFDGKKKGAQRVLNNLHKKMKGTGIK